MFRLRGHYIEDTNKAGSRRVMFKRRQDTTMYRAHEEHSIASRGRRRVPFIMVMRNLL